MQMRLRLPELLAEHKPPLTAYAVAKASKAYQPAHDLPADSNKGRVMKRIAAPMVGRMVSSTLLTLLVIPAIYSLWKEREIREQTRAAADPVVVEG